MAYRKEVLEQMEDERQVKQAILGRAFEEMEKPKRTVHVQGVRETTNTKPIKSFTLGDCWPTTK